MSVLQWITIIAALASLGVNAWTWRQVRRTERELDAIDMELGQIERQLP